MLRRIAAIILLISVLSSGCAAPPEAVGAAETAPSGPSLTSVAASPPATSTYPPASSPSATAAPATPTTSATPVPSPTPSSPASSDAPASTQKDLGDFRVVRTPVEDELYQEWAQIDEESGVYEELAADLNAILALPRDIDIVHDSCGTENAFYLPAESTVVMCWELYEQILTLVEDLGGDEDEYADMPDSIWMFILFHEIGHALVDAYELPITGREEDAVDDFATLLLIDADMSDAAIYAALYWVLADQGVYDDAAFADEHSLNPQRFYTILCTVYGSDPETYAWVVEEDYLPPARAERCPTEYAQKDRAWTSLIEPWIKDDS